jgi:CUB domain
MLTEQTEKCTIHSILPAINHWLGCSGNFWTGRSHPELVTLSWLLFCIKLLRMTMYNVSVSMFVVQTATPACSASSRPLNLTGNSGSLTSPLYPSYYSNNADCQWLIVSPSADTVRIPLQLVYGGNGIIHLRSCVGR